MYATSLPKTGFTLTGLLVMALTLILVGMLMMRAVVLRRI